LPCQHGAAKAQQTDGGDQPVEARIAVDGHRSRGENAERDEQKRASHELTKLGEELVALRPSRFATLALPELLQEAVVEARRLKSFGAQRRQAQFIGKLMRKLDEESLAALRKALERP
jgi:ribosome-associated protein